MTSTGTFPTDHATTTAPSVWVPLSLLAALGSAVVGGSLYAFSGFVMSGLDRAGVRTAIAAMQGINQTAVRAPFMIPFMGTTALCLGLAVVGTIGMRRGQPMAALILLGSTLYLISFAITAVYHVPHNDALAKIDPDSVGAAQAWHDYVRGWTAMNHVRVATSLAAAGAFVAAVLRR